MEFTICGFVFGSYIAGGFIACACVLSEYNLNGKTYSGCLLGADIEMGNYSVCILTLEAQPTKRVV